MAVPSIMRFGLLVLQVRSVIEYAVHTRPLKELDPPV
jgi:hypothetical protein